MMDIGVHETWGFIVSEKVNNRDVKDPSHCHIIHFVFIK